MVIYKFTLFLHQCSLLIYDDLNYRDNGYIPEKELQRNMEILFASLDQIVTIT